MSYITPQTGRRFYTVYEDTIGGILNKILSLNQVYTKALRTIQVRSDKEIEEEAKHYDLTTNEESISARIETDSLRVFAQQIVSKRLLNKESLLESAIETEMMNLGIKVAVYFTGDTAPDCNYHMHRTVFVNGVESCLGIHLEDAEKDAGCIKDDARLLEELKKVKSWTYGRPKKRIIMSSLNVCGYVYEANHIKEDIGRAVRAALKEECAYCLKNGKVIVPDEYMNKGEAGIAEWRELKRKQNKNNSIEKQMLRQIVQEKKQFADNCMNRFMATIINTNNDWSIPSLGIDGSWNKGKCRKLITEVLGVKNNPKLTGVEKSDIEKLCREYWKKILMDAYGAVDKKSVADIK